MRKMICLNLVLGFLICLLISCEKTDNFIKEDTADLTKTEVSVKEQVEELLEKYDLKHMKINFPKEKRANSFCQAKDLNELDSILYHYSIMLKKNETNATRRYDEVKTKSPLYKASLQYLDINYAGSCVECFGDVDLPEILSGCTLEIYVNWSKTHRMPQLVEVWADGEMIVDYLLLRFDWGITGSVPHIYTYTLEGVLFFRISYTDVELMDHLVVKVYGNCSAPQMYVNGVISYRDESWDDYMDRNY